MKLTAKELLKIGIIDEVITEPNGGAHRNELKIVSETKKVLVKHLEEFENYSGDEILEQRKNKFIQIGKQKRFISFSNNQTNIFKENTFFKRKFVLIGMFVLFLGIFLFFIS